MDESEDEEGSWLAELIAYNRHVFQLQEMNVLFRLFFILSNQSHEGS